jgi:prophage antirepressor-like protein|nr:MAG TPA: repressor domain protein [Caudoviricetes sp.]
MNEIEIFKNEEFGEVRTTTIDGEPYFVGKDVAKILGYAKPLNALATHVDKDDSLKQGLIDNLGRDQDTIFINESGLYSLILSSKLPNAKKFKHWVTAEVLPSIRKHGGYISNADLMVNTYFSNLPDEQKVVIKGLLTNIVAVQNENSVLKKENDVLAQENSKWAGKDFINAIVRKYGRNVRNNYAKGWVDFKKELLYKYSINLNSRITHYLNTSGKRTKPKTLDLLDESEIEKAASTIVTMCRENKVDITEELKKYGNINMI